MLIATYSLIGTPHVTKENTVFISYRRTNVFMARAIYQHLSTQGFEVFFDYESIKAGDFTQIILKGIESHAHFLPLLTPSALERCTDPNDWVRREIEHAMQHKRNIIPLTMEGFDFGDINKYMPHIADAFSRYNGIRIPSDYFEAAMDKLIGYLNQPLDTVLRPATPQVRQFKQEQAQQVAAQPKVTERQLSAEEWFEKGIKLDDNSDEEIRCYTEAIKLNPEYARAYAARGNAHEAIGNTEQAKHDFGEATKLIPTDSEGYFGRGNAYFNQGDTAAAIRDYTEAIRLKPDDALAYHNRGDLFRLKGEFQKAIQDCDKAIQSDPNNKFPYATRGAAKRALGDYTGAIADFDIALRLDPNYAFAKSQREIALEKQRGQ